MTGDDKNEISGQIMVEVMKKLFSLDDNNNK